MMRKEKQGRKWNNRGAALVTVVVVTAFISILVTIILYISGMNYYMKATDKKNKDSFYEAETAMESIKAKLMIESKLAFQEAYKETLIKFARSSADDRTLTYNQTFANTIKDNFDDYMAADHTAGGEGTLESYVRTMVPANYVTTPNTLSVNSSALEVHADDGYVMLRGVKLQYIKDGYLSEISTDFMIKVPKIDWGVEASAIAWAGDPNDLIREEYEMADCVIYYNWTKNEEVP